MRTQFERDGWTVVRGVVAPSEFATMHDVFTALVPPNSDGALRELTGASLAYPPLAAIARDPRFGSLAAEVLGASQIQLLQDSLLYKPARGGAVEWHQDHSYVGFLVPARVIAIRLALLPEREDNGCMRVVSGSHRWGSLGANRSLTADSVTSLVDELTESQRAELACAEPLVLAPGDVSIHHCLTAHGSGINPSEQPRRTIILRMFDATCRFDATRVPEHVRGYFPTTADGGLSTDAFPIVFGAP